MNGWIDFAISEEHELLTVKSISIYRQVIDTIRKCVHTHTFAEMLSLINSSDAK